MATRTSRKRYANTAETADYTGFSPVTLRKWRWQGKGPPFTGRGPNIRYDLDDVNRWMAQRKGNERT